MIVFSIKIIILTVLLIKRKRENKNVKKAIVKQVENDDPNNSVLSESNNISMDQNSILSVTQHQPPLPKLYKENIQLDPRYDLC